MKLCALAAFLFLFIIAPQSASAKSVEHAATIARGIVLLAKPSAPTIYEKIYAQLSNPILVRPPAEDFATCKNDPETIAFTTPRVDSNIYLCFRALLLSEHEIAQILIHEAAHLAGFMDECEATVIERGAMRAAGFPAYRNGYTKRCGLN